MPQQPRRVGSGSFVVAAGAVLRDSQFDRIQQILIANRFGQELSVAELTQKSGEQHEALRKTVEERLDAIRNENAEKLDQMRQTVDEKLQSTLDQRLGASFQIVADRLNEVYKSMGEMQTWPLASAI